VSNPSCSLSPNPSRIRFQQTGKFFDEVTNLQDNINRWYDTNGNRWISEDPIGFCS